MQTATKDVLTFVWWNTSLSPNGKSRENTETAGIVQSVVKYFIDVLGIDCLALGEITSNDLRMLRGACQSAQHRISDGSGKINKSFYDTGLIYNSEQLQELFSCKIHDNEINQTLKIAYRVDFAILATKEPLHLFVSHWPSRRNDAKNRKTRNRLGDRLRRVVTELINEEKGSIPIILMGDYNDEPFDVSICECLISSRDRGLAQRRKDLLYNPSWRLLGESKPFKGEIENKSFAGTHYYRSGIETRWHTFDQFIVSSSLLNTNGWYLDEAYVKIWQDDLFCALINNSNEIFDHFPILCVIKRKSDKN